MAASPQRPHDAYASVSAGEPDEALVGCEGGLGELASLIARACALEQTWLGRVRRSLVALLGFVDDEPVSARMLFAGEGLPAQAAYACEERVQDLLLDVLEDRPQGTVVVGEGLLSPRLTGELVVGGVFAVIRNSLLEDDRSPLVELAPSLLSFVVTPYLGQAIASADLAAQEDAEILQDAEISVELSGLLSSAQGVSPAIARTLPIRVTHRTTLVLRAIAKTPCSSNRQIAQAAGLADEGQASKLLQRLQGRDLIVNRRLGQGHGVSNAWQLTSYGERVLAQIARPSMFATETPVLHDRRAFRRPSA